MNHLQPKQLSFSRTAYLVTSLLIMAHSSSFFLDNPGNILLNSITVTREDLIFSIQIFYNYLAHFLLKFSMKKEVLFAILVGFTIGLIITFGIYKAQQSYQNSQTSFQDQQSPENQETVDTQPLDLGLEITQPLHESVFTTSSITIRGITNPNSYVTAVSTDHQNFSQSSSSGTFNLDFQLEPGANLITVTSLNDLQTEQTKNLTITLLDKPDSENNQDSTDETQPE